MNAKEFRDAVRTRAAPDFLQRGLWALEVAMKYFVQEKRTQSLNDVHKCVELAGEIAQAAPALQAGSTERSEPCGTSSPSRQIMRNRLLAMCEPVVERVRQKIFGSPEPPFASYEDAVAWLEEADKAQPRPTLAEEARCALCAQRLMEHIRELGRLAHTDMWLEARPRFLPYLKQIGTPRRPALAYRTIRVYSASPGLGPYLDPMPEEPPLTLIEKVVRGMTGVTGDISGFSPLGCVAYCLTPYRPRLTRAQYRLSHDALSFSGEIVFTRATVTLYSPHVSFREFREINRELRMAWHATKTKRLTDDDYRLLAIVERLGGEPPRGKKAFWEQVRQAYNPPKGQTGRALQVRYWRLQERLARW